MDAENGLLCPPPARSSCSKWLTVPLGNWARFACGCIALAGGIGYQPVIRGRFRAVPVVTSARVGPDQGCAAFWRLESG